uniref:RxLR effector candidate protein n=1 Tax=Hyaloperonospora arabidopsidis (strain Emoy2) TaxID=559515 RepID=M4BYB1_HYAAE
MLLHHRLFSVIVLWGTTDASTADIDRTKDAFLNLLTLPPRVKTSASVVSSLSESDVSTVDEIDTNHLDGEDRGVEFINPQRSPD